MSGPVEEGEEFGWGRRILLILVGLGLLAAWVAVWWVSSGHFKLPHDRPAPPVADQPPPPQKADGGHKITSADWRRKPTGDDLARYYPRQAARKGVGGKAVITCGITTEGRLTNCAVVSETPPGWSFGEAALKLSGEFRMWPSTRDGKPVAGGQVRIPIVFNPPKG